MATRNDTQTLLSRVLRASIGIGLVTACTLAGLALLPVDDDGGYAIEHGAEAGTDQAPTTPTRVELEQRAALAPLEVLPQAITVRAIANDPAAATAAAAGTTPRPLRDRYTNPLVRKGLKDTTEGFWAAWPALKLELTARLAAASRANPQTLASAAARIATLDKLNGSSLRLSAARTQRFIRRDFSFNVTMLWIGLALTVTRAEAEHAASPPEEPPFTDEAAQQAVLEAHGGQAPTGDCVTINSGSWSPGNTPPPPARSRIAEGGWLGFIATANAERTGGIVTYYACY